MTQGEEQQILPLGRMLDPEQDPYKHAYTKNHVKEGRNVTVERLADGAQSHSRDRTFGDEADILQGQHRLAAVAAQRQLMATSFKVDHLGLRFRVD